MVSADRESSVDKYQSAGWHFPVFPQGPAAARQRGIWPCANVRAKGCVAVAQGAKAVRPLGNKGRHYDKTFTTALAGDENAPPFGGAALCHMTLQEGVEKPILPPE